ncbi:hypothetical protein TTHERM_00726020 (macronuclear) [Tetrahymena thermophila SB210]|uniref:Uncharacterized protein n=1 Tax=Tetrahymena thermophila (strain SB210) TaxID=312017 RepID=Q24GI8_TETTS|nr:hypothetical protein TTHERM_00726020 [Tetrahymena thermophila SB210]EAS06883.1 hypothetical protein TTHERM_00726020 [Tetrahymena thermophila SB210]|eukprot:XP_001027125.1 hypothetical protein TTHERM_00726020 [Tetrahymena thermophila SB210]
MLSKILSSESEKFIKLAFGNAKNLESSKFIYSINLLSQGPSNDELKVIIKNEYTPSLPIDYKAFSFLRCFCDIYVTSGESVRKQNNDGTQSKPEFLGFKDWEQLFKQTPNNKINYILSQKFDKQTLYQMNAIKAPHQKTLLTNNPKLEEEIKKDQSLQNYIEQYQIQFTPPMDNLQEAINYLQKTYPEQRVLIELGITTVKQALNIIDPAIQPLDLLVLSIYQGFLEEEFIGQNHPNLQFFQQSFDLVHTSEKFEAYKGFIQFFIFKKKHSNNL